MGVPRAGKRRSYRAKPLSRLSSRFKYKEQFGVIVICQGERDQARLYRRLLRQGHPCKVVVV